MNITLKSPHYRTQKKILFPVGKSFMQKVLLVCGLLLLTYSYALAQKQEDISDNKTLSPYFVVISEDPAVDNLPLKETSIQAIITGMIADVTVKQVYTSTGKNTLEAIYTFPLSTKAAVYSMKMTIGTRVITAKIEEKEKARKDYEQAKSEGKRASLLEQSRPNVFTMNVTNIAVNDTIMVELQYTELLIPEKGKYTFVYPTVVGPRYSNKSKSKAGIDDEFVSTPYTKSGEMPAYTFDFQLSINSGIPIQNISCNTHKMLIAHPSMNKSFLKLDSTERKGGNRDIIINYSLQGDKIESGIMLYERGDENFFLLMVQPPKQVLKEDIPPREYIFIVDVSGSMWGFPIDISKKLMRNLIVNLKPDDKFNVLLFSGWGALFSKQSVNATEGNVDKAMKFIDKQQGGGGTELMQALEQAYKIPRLATDLSRTFVIVTDGYISVEREAFEFIRTHSDNTNFFSFGIGSGVNRYLIEGMAFMGNGEPMIITKPNEAEKQAEQFRNYINTPVLTQIKVDYGSFQTYDIEPVAIPDMLAERPIVIFGKYKGKPTGTITLTGKTGQKTYKQSFTLSKVKPNPDYTAIRYLWARERIKLLDYLVTNNSYGTNTNANNDKDIKTITELGLKYNLMTNYTSFIAIDEQTIVKDGKLVTVKQPIPLPEGVSDYAVGYETQVFAGSGVITGKHSIINMNDARVEMPGNRVTYGENEVEIKDEEEPQFALPDANPEFPGGDNAREQFILDNFVYPKGGTANPNASSCKLIVGFIVELDGSLVDIKILRSCGNKIFEKEIIRVIKLMPKWKPAQQEGVIIRSQIALPITIPAQK
jgi:Ca-activated chloride channel family protein